MDFETATNQSDQVTLKRIRACNYLTVTQLFLQDNFLLERPLEFSDIKPRLLGHWGTCPGINLVYSCMRDVFADKKEETVFVLGPGHGFPALQANLFYDGDLAVIDKTLKQDYAGLAKVSKLFSRIGGFPSHASPSAPGVICEGGELGYSLATAYGYCLGHPERTAIVLIGDGEFETATALASLNLNDLLLSSKNGKIIPVLHLNGYKISGPTVAGRRSERQLNELLRGFGYTPIRIVERLDSADDLEDFETPDDAFETSSEKIEKLVTNTIREEELSSLSDDTTSINQSMILAFSKLQTQTAIIMQNLVFDLKDTLKQATQDIKSPFIILETEKGLSGPVFLDDTKIRGNFKAHQIPLAKAKTDYLELQTLETWLKSYHFEELFSKEEGLLFNEK